MSEIINMTDKQTAENELTEYVKAMLSLTPFGRDGFGTIFPEGIKAEPCQALSYRQMRFLDDHIEQKACYNNSVKSMTELMSIDRQAAHETGWNITDKPGLTYVMGYGLSVIPIEHAWIKVDGIYYDPTWQKFSKLSDYYFPMFEVQYPDIFDMLTEFGFCPPSPLDYLTKVLLENHRQNKAV